MTLKYLRQNWQDLAIVIKDEKNEKTNLIPLRERFMLCIPSEALVVNPPERKTFGKCLLFDTGGEIGNPSYLMKSDRGDKCLVFDYHDESWKPIGKFVKVNGKLKKKKPLKKKKLKKTTV